MRARYPLYLKITLASFLVALVVLAFVAVVEYGDHRRDLQDKFGLTLQHIAQTSALFIDGDTHELVHGAGDVGFSSFRDLLERVRRENQLVENQIYTLRPSGNGQYEFVIMLQEKTFVGDRYVPPPMNREIMEWVLKDGVARYTPIYSDSNGTFVSAYAPIRKSNGEAVAILEVDYSIERFLSELRTEMEQRLWVIPVALLLAFVLALLVARNITTAVKELLKATGAIEREQYDTRVDIRTRDELRTLGDAFNRMLTGLKERFTMLRFVPRHTRAVIAQSVRENYNSDEAFVAQRREVTVLFSDIRGFTSLSEGLGAQKIIAMLDIYLRKEAEIIERHDGSIDKFIGDAVMAVFEGEQRTERAAMAAIEIQKAMHDLNEKKVFDRPIHIGIGIASGQAVMGSVGSAQRMEFAVIGPIVNLASRLCSLAKADEVVFSEEAWQTLGRTDGETVEGIQLKGFAQPIRCHRVLVG